MRGLRRTLGRGVALGVLAGATSGCRAVPRDLSTPQPAVPQLVEVARAVPSPDLSAVPLAPVPPIAPAPVPYVRLTAHDCRVAACRHALLARGIVAVAAESGSGLQTHSQAAVDALRLQVSVGLAREARNRAAGGALELYYRLQEAELLADLLDRSLAETDALVSAADILKAGGYAEAPEVFVLRRSQLELQADRLKLTAGIDRLNAELKPLLGLPLDGPRLLPADPVAVAPDRLDLTAAVSLAKQARGDLQAIRALHLGLNEQTVDAVRQAVAGLLPPLGALTAASNTLAPGLRVLLPFLKQPDTDAVRRQLDLLQQTREDETARDLATAIEEYHSQRDRLAVSRRRVEAETVRVAEFGVKRGQGLPVEAEWRRAKLDLYAAERQQLTDAYAWQRADVTVRQLLGLLCDGPECGQP